MQEQAKFSFWKQAAIYGLILAAVSVFLSLVFYFTDLYLKTWSQLLNMVVGLGLLIYLMILYRKEVRGGYASFGQMFSMSFTTSMISAVVGVAFGILMMNVLFPDMKEALHLMVEEKIFNNPRIPESYVDQAIEKAKKSFEPGRQAMNGLIYGGVINAILCLIVAAVLKKDDPAQEV